VQARAALEQQPQAIDVTEPRSCLERSESLHMANMNDMRVTTISQ